MKKRNLHILFTTHVHFEGYERLGNELIVLRTRYCICVQRVSKDDSARSDDVGEQMCLTTTGAFRIERRDPV